MAASTKILTVSYGTFSCTLEGFDDSFGSMKAIAEYFRDLAQEDRYFGAEPPAPDAEMLAKIAEREISRRVEAQMDGKGIRLRAAIAPEPTETAVAMPPKAEAPAEQSTYESPSALMPAAPLVSPKAEEEDTAAQAEPAAAPLTSEAPAHPDAESVAAKLQRIRAVVGKSAPTVDENDEEGGFDDAPSLDDVLSAEPDVAVTAEDIIAEDEDTAEAEAKAAEEAAKEEAEAKAAEEAAKAEAEAKAAEEAAKEEAEAKAAEEAAKAEAEARAAEEAAKAEAEAKAAEEAAKAEAEARAAEEAAKAEAEAKAAEEAAKADAEAKAAEEAAKVEAEARAAEEAAKVEAEAKAAEEAAKAEAEAKAAEEAAKADAAEAEEEDLSSDLNDIDLPAQPAKAPVRARIVRLRKDKPAEVIPAEAPVADDSDDIASRVTARLQSDAPVPQPAPEPEAQEPTDIRAAVAAAIPAGSLSADDEDDLQRELAAVSEEIVSVDEAYDETPVEVVVEDLAEEATDVVAEEEPAAEIEEEAAAAAPAQEEVAEAAPEMPEVVETSPRAGRRSLPETDDAAMSRIMTQTDEALNEPTGSRRRNAIAQLKAAVAATEAARQLGDKSKGEAEAQEAFREDLDHVVRPRRPSTPIETDELRTHRPRTTPLKLVASQRIDGEDMPEPDVQPRRVASSPIDASDVSGFAEFAAQMGATELPDLLEAAAAYTSFVEGVEDFSRPQIMKKVQLTTEEEFSREDGLRSFGTLLRQGRISKVRNGRFQISEQTRFRPDARSA